MYICIFELGQPLRSKFGLYRKLTITKATELKHINTSLNILLNLLLGWLACFSMHEKVQLTY